MPGIFGFYTARLTGDESAIAMRMMNSLAHHPWYVSRTFTTANGLLTWGWVGHEVPSGAQSNHSAPPAVLLDGELYGPIEPGSRNGSSIGYGDDATHLLAALHGAPEAHLQSVEGFFSAAAWNSDDETLLLMNDRFGMKPLYYARVDGGFVFGSEIKSVLKHPGVARRRSLKGISQFLTFGHLLGTDTFFESIQSLSPGTVVRYSARSGTVIPTRWWQIRNEPLISTERDALVALDEAFGRAVERRLTGSKQIGLSLSGGLDARTILAAAPRSGVPIKSVSLGIPGSIDHRVASRLAAIASAEHHCHFLEGDFLQKFPAHLQTLVELTDGHYLDQAITVPTLPVYRDLGIEVLLRGHAGELFHMDKAYAFSMRPEDVTLPDGAAVERWLWEHLTHYMIGGIGHDMFRPGIRGEAAASARTALQAALCRSDSLSPPAQRLWHLFITERLPRETALSLQMFNSVVPVRLPYLDNALVDVIMRVHPSIKMGDLIQSFILQRRMPAFLNITNANTGTTLRASSMRREIASFRLKVFSKLRVPGYQPYERLGLWLSGPLQPMVRNLVLSDQALGRDLFDPDRVRKLVDDHSARTRNHTFLIMAMMIFELGQRALVDDVVSADVVSGTR